MAEVEYKGIKVGGSKLLIIIPFVGTVVGGLWGGFELYNRLLLAESKLNNLQPAAITAEINRLESIYTVIRDDLQGDIDSTDSRITYNTSEITVARDELGALTRLTERMSDQMDRMEESINESLDLARDVESNTSETQREVRNDVYEMESQMQERFREMDDLIREMRNELEDRISTILENPLNDVE
jgi:predicted  nucleic acid-binding Zn-ribbon protein|tara:strand:- start:85 stop:642 length:558 start_codon:yes stop_codon:yes gene_type:complete